MTRLFGTDGVRGVYPDELSDELAYQLGRYGTFVLSDGKNQPNIIIGTDTRVSAKPLEKALAEGIISAGGNVYKTGVIPTPAIAVLVKELKADCGVMISASHNPYEFNGIKFFSGSGFKLSDELEDQIEEAIKTKPTINNKTQGMIRTIDCPDKIYTDHVLSGFQSPDLAGLKIVLDCANGALSDIAPSFFKTLGAEVISLSDSPDGMNINADCGSTHMDNLIEKVVETQSDIGFAFDGDADRCLAVDEYGDLMDGDVLLNLIGNQFKKENKLKDDVVVATVMSNIGLDLALKNDDIRTVKTDVGDRYVLQEMLAHGYTLGGEQSGHVIMLDHNTTGDGLLTALMMAVILKNTNETASSLRKRMTSYPQILVNAKVPNSKKHAYLDDLVIQNAIHEVEDHFEGEGRVLVRPSGTEPLVRVMIEGKNQEELTTIAKDLADLIEKRCAE